MLNILEAGGGEMDVRCCYLENENLNQSSQSLLGGNGIGHTIFSPMFVCVCV